VLIGRGFCKLVERPLNPGGCAGESYKKIQRRHRRRFFTLRPTDEAFSASRSALTEDFDSAVGIHNRKSPLRCSVNEWVHVARLFALLHTAMVVLCEKREGQMER